MSNINLNGINEQITKFFIEPVRAFAGLSVDHVEKLTNTQIQAAQAYTKTGLSNAREAIAVSDVEGVKGFVQKQQKAAQALGERIKGDLEGIAGLNQQFVESTQKLAQDSVRNLASAAQAK